MEKELKILKILKVNLLVIKF
jgi:hypothetical protein